MPHITTGEHHGEPIRLYYEDHGAGKPVVLIHGWPLSLRSWENQIPALVEAGHRVVAYDRRGFGESSQPWDGYDYDTFAKDLDTLLTQLDLRDVTLVGFSMGGGEVARYVKTYGTGRVSKAVFAAAVPPYLYKSADNPDGGLDDATIEQFQSGIRGDRIAFVDQFLRDFFAAGERTDLVSEAQRAYALQIASFASPKGTLDCVAAFARTDFRGDLEGFGVPTLVIHGDSDKIVPFEVSGRRTHESIPGSRLVLVEGAQHGFNATHAERFNSELLAFLNS